MNADYWP
jgi:hypothetical protein